MNRGLTGYYLPISSFGESCKAFVPHPLPPSPPLEMGEELQDLLHKATLALGRLDGVSTLLPDPELFLYMYIRKEAVLSSQIEGTQSSLSDLLLFESEELPGVPLDDVREVSNYVAAMNFGLKKLQAGEPLSLRLLREIHNVLLNKGRGSEKEPGEFKRSQNWIGGTRPGNAAFVPVPPDLVIECLGALENFLHDRPVKTPVLVKAALAHVQFETIHPFLDGNGRLGRLLITFLICAEGELNQPMLYLSLYFKTHRTKYYDLLQEVRLKGDWENWIRFFLIGIHETATQAVQTAKRLLELFKKDRQRIQKFGLSAGSALRVHHFLQANPITSISKASGALEISFQTVKTALIRMKDLGIVREISGRRRNQLFAYEPNLKILSEGTEPLK